MITYRYFVLVLILFLSACSGGAGVPTSTLVPTLGPPPTSEVPPVDPTTLAPEATSAGPPITPTLVPPGADPSAEDQDAIYIGQPGPQSEVVSPVLVSGFADAAFEQSLVIRVDDQDGNLLSIRPVSIQADLGERGAFEAEAEFSVANDQPGRISVFDIDARDGSLVHLSSVEVTLLASGEANIQPPIVTDEIIEITTPEFQADVTGGTLLLEGFSEYFFEANLSVVLCADGTDSDVSHPVCGTSDNVFAEGFATINSPDIGQPGPFQGEIQFNVEGPKIVRVIVYAVSARDGGLLHASSTLVTLLP